MNFRAMGTCCASAVVLALSGLPAWAWGADAVVGLCAEQTPGRIAVQFEDRLPQRDGSRGVEDLKRLSGSRLGPYHSVLGVTHAEPYTRLDFKLDVAPAADGGVCAVPSLTLTLGFSRFEVLLAKELRDSCRQGVVADHEREHVNVWRDHFRAGARMITTVLQRDLGQPAHFASRAEAEARLRPRAEQAVAALLASLGKGISQAHQDIDAPSSYQAMENRLRACS